MEYKTPILFRNKTWLEIMQHILEEIQRKGISSKTNLMYKNNLNHRQINEYLSIMIQKNLITSVPHQKTRQLYKMTERGERFIMMVDEVRNFLK